MLLVAVKLSPCNVLVFTSLSYFSVSYELFSSPLIARSALFYFIFSASFVYRCVYCFAVVLVSLPALFVCLFAFCVSHHKTPNTALSFRLSWNFFLTILQMYVRVSFSFTSSSFSSGAFCMCLFLLLTSNSYELNLISYVLHVQQSIFQSFANIIL